MDRPRSAVPRSMLIVALLGISTVVALAATPLLRHALSPEAGAPAPDLAPVAAIPQPTPRVLPEAAAPPQAIPATEAAASVAPLPVETAAPTPGAPPQRAENPPIQAWVPSRAPVPDATQTLSLDDPPVVAAREDAEAEGDRPPVGVVPLAAKVPTKAARPQAPARPIAAAPVKSPVPQVWNSLEAPRPALRQAPPRAPRVSAKASEPIVLPQALLPSD